MKIYFAGSIRGGRSKLDVYKKVVKILQESGCEVLTTHVAKKDVIEKESSLYPEEVFERDIELLEEADALVAEVSTPSLGVGFEVCYALQLGKPVLCLASVEDDERVSWMIKGNRNIIYEVYSNDSDLREKIEAFLDYVSSKF